MLPQQITSIKDERVVEARALSSVAGRKQRQKCLLEDVKIIEWALEANIPVERVFFHNKIDSHPLFAQLADREIECFAVSEGILKKISNTRYLVPFIGVGNMAEKEELPPLHDFVIVLDDVRDHGNVGTIIRTARAFGIRDILSTTQELDLHYRKTIEASRGKVFDVRLKRFSSETETLDFLKQQGFQIIATSPHAPFLQSSVKLQPKPIALAVGNETDGVSEKVLQKADLVVQIPMSRQVESLNVGVATGISVSEFKLKLVLAMLVKYIRTTLGREVNVTGKVIQMALDKELAKVTPLSSMQVILLMILKCDETMTLEQVGRDTATFGEECKQLLQPLFEQGYIIYDKDVSSPTIRLTGSGEQLLGQLWGKLEAIEDKMLQGFTGQEKRELNTYLKRIQANCEEIIRR